VHCKNEEKELQCTLENNLFLLPGEQIRPEDPGRWLLIRREMAVPNPSTGEDHWSIDLFLVDQSGIPTFVECKRFKDTRSRREVVAQMLDYAANGHYYWDRDLIRGHATAAAEIGGKTLEESIADLQADTGESVEEFFELVEENLRGGRVRMVFYLEEAPFELKSIVDFLNRQMELSEILIVEARQYEIKGARVIAPAVFGYTEEARRAKRSGAGATSSRKAWTEEMFFADAEERVEKDTYAALKRLFEWGREKNHRIRWGTGARNGTFSLVAEDICRRSFLSALSNGELWINYGWLSGNPAVELFREQLVTETCNLFQLDRPDDIEKGTFSLNQKTWPSFLDQLISAIEGGLDRARQGA
jgi:hypothetical protein